MLKAPEGRFVPPRCAAYYRMLRGGRRCLEPIRQWRIHAAHSGRELSDLLGSAGAESNDENAGRP